MFKRIVPGLLILLSAATMAAPYPLGTMTCADIGSFA